MIYIYTHCIWTQYIYIYRYIIYTVYIIYHITRHPRMEGLVSQDSSKHIGSIWDRSLHGFGPGTTSEDEMDSSHEARVASLNYGFSSATVSGGGWVPAYLSDIDLFRLFGMVLGVPLPRLAKWLIRIDPPIGIAFIVWWTTQRIRWFSPSKLHKMIDFPNISKHHIYIIYIYIHIYYILYI